MESDGAGYTLSFDLHMCAQGHTTSHIPKIKLCQIITVTCGGDWVFFFFLSVFFQFCFKQHIYCVVVQRLEV